MKKIVSICLCLMILISFTTSIFTENIKNQEQKERQLLPKNSAETYIKKKATSHRIKRIMFGTAITALGCSIVANRDSFIRDEDRETEQTPIDIISGFVDLLMAGIYYSGFIMIPIGINVLVTPGEYEKTAKGQISTLPDPELRESKSYEKIKSKAVEKKIIRYILGSITAYKAYEAAILPDTVGVRDKTVGMWGLFSCYFFIVKSSEEKFIMKYPNNAFKEDTMDLSIHPMICPDYIGLSVAKRF